MGGWDGLPGLTVREVGSGLRTLCLCRTWCVPGLGAVQHGVPGVQVALQAPSCVTWAGPCASVPRVLIEPLRVCTWEHTCLQWTSGLASGPWGAGLQFLLWVALGTLCLLSKWGSLVSRAFLRVSRGSLPHVWPRGVMQGAGQCPAPRVCPWGLLRRLSPGL